jgi:hypothetical protein
MKRILAVAIFATAVLTLVAPRALAQDKSARGTVSAMTADSLTVKVGMTSMTFHIESGTDVVAPGAGTAARRADAAGAPAPSLADVVKVGNPVMINFHDMGMMHHATRVQVISSAGPGGGAVSTPAMTANGTVTSVSASSLVVTVDGKATTFAVDEATDVIGRGAGTAAATSGGHLAVTEVVHTGDSVNVTYQEMGSTKHVAEIRVMGAGR